MCGRTAPHECERSPNAGFETSRVDRAVKWEKCRKTGLKTSGAHNSQEQNCAEIVFHAARKQPGESSFCSDSLYMAGCHGVFKANRAGRGGRGDLALTAGAWGFAHSAATKSEIGR